GPAPSHPRQEVLCRSRSERHRTVGSAGLFHLVEQSGGHVEHEAADLVGVRDEGACLDPRDRLTHVAFQVGEGFGRPGRLDAGVLGDARLELVIGERLHATVGVVDEDDLPGAKQPLADGERPDLVIGDDAARVPDDVGLALLEPEYPVNVEPGVHARHDRSGERRWYLQRVVEILGIDIVVGEHPISDGHIAEPPDSVANGRVVALGERDHPAVGKTTPGAMVFRTGCHVFPGWDAVRPDEPPKGYEWDRELVEATRWEAAVTGSDAGGKGKAGSGTTG